jgi:predicted TIM-barrel fold metal-dependent hydrolase
VEVDDPRIIDTHAHVFRRDLPMAADRRYTPAQDAALDRYLAVLDRHGVDRGILIQPSFLGTDNRFLLRSLKKTAGRIKGIAVVDPAAGRQTLKILQWVGIVGIRLNLFGLPTLPDLTGDDWQRLLGELAERDWQVQLHVEGARLPPLLEHLSTAGVKVVVDHFGRPDPAHGVACSGFQALLRTAKTGRVWVKLSAPYRLGAGDAFACATALLNAFGPERLLWGSDWPWTQHEDGMAYAYTLEWLAQWIPAEAARRRILWETPARLFGFETSEPRATNHEPRG